MSNFWPENLNVKDTQSPIDILESAQADWKNNSEGIMELILQFTQSESGNDRIIVHAKHVIKKRMATLFSIVHRPNKPYPVAIDIDTEELPNFLRKSYESKQEAAFDVLRMLQPRKELLEADKVIISNPWVADTPSEFRQLLAEAFNESSTKGIIINLVSSAAKSTQDETQKKD